MLNRLIDKILLRQTHAVPVHNILSVRVTGLPRFVDGSRKAGELMLHQLHTELASRWNSKELTELADNYTPDLANCTSVVDDFLYLERRIMCDVMGQEKLDREEYYALSFEIERI